MLQHIIISAILLIVPLLSSGEIKVTQVADGYSATSVNTTIFRGSALTSHGNYQYVAFYDPDGYVTIGRRTHDDKSWTLQRSPYSGNVRDAHNGISIGVDGDGYLHVAFDHHGTPLKYCRSTAAGSIQLGELEPMTGQDENDVTYPEFHTLPDGTLLFVYRSGYSGGGNMVMNSYDPKTGKWTRIHDVLIDGEGLRNAYWQMCVDKSGTIHLSWVWRETWMVETNHDLCYAKSTDGGKSWVRSDGLPYSLPITEASAELAWSIPQNSELINQTSMAATPDGRPLIATYWRDADDSIPQFRLVWHDGEKWNMECVGKRTTPFTLAGGGTKMIPISRPKVTSDNSNIYYIFRDIERKNRVSIAIKGKEDEHWLITDLTDYDVDAWEPCIDDKRWRDSNSLNIYVQKTSQGDGEKVTATPPRPIEIIEYTLNRILVNLANNLDIDRTDMVELDNRFAKNITILDYMGHEVPHQITYDNKLIFPASVNRNSEVIYHIIEGYPSQADTVACGKLYPERLDDMTWENDLSAYRAYGPSLQKSGEKAFGYDIWTKSVPFPVVSQRYRDHINGKSFHVDHGNGMDVYSVGPTLGAGTAVMLDSLGNIIYPWCFKDYEILDNGPLRFTVRLTYENEIRLISLDAGSHFNKTEVCFNALSDSVTVAAGFVVHHSDNNARFVASAHNYFLAGYADPTDNQASDNGEIYVGIIVQGSNISSEFRPVDDSIAIGHLLLKKGLSPMNKPFTYYWGSGWSKASVESIENWKNIMTKYILLKTNPLKITVLQ